MLARVRSAAVLGIDAYLVDVETDIANGLPTFATVGLPQGAVKEGRERVYAAIANSGYTFPLKRITGKVRVKREGREPRLPLPADQNCDVVGGGDLNETYCGFPPSRLSAARASAT